MDHDLISSEASDTMRPHTHDQEPDSASQSAEAATGQLLGAMQLNSSTSHPDNSSSSSSNLTSRAKIHCFTEQAPDATIHFQLIDLGLQLYIWVAVGGAKLQNMYLAIQSKQVCKEGVCVPVPVCLLVRPQLRFCMLIL